METKMANKKDIEIMTTTTAGGEPVTEPERLAMMHRLQAQVLALISLRWVYNWANRLVVILWMELMFLIYWPLAFNTAYGGVGHYWKQHLEPILDMAALNGDAFPGIAAAFMIAVGTFMSYYTISVYLFISLFIGFHKQNENRLVSWTAITSVFVPFLLGFLIYLIVIRGVMDSLVLSMISIIGARVLVIMLVVETTEELSIATMAMDASNEMNLAAKAMEEGGFDFDGDEEDNGKGKWGSAKEREAAMGERVTEEKIKRLEALGIQHVGICVYNTGAAAPALD